jgi:membrane protease YdiL (CAAX protease family)
MNDKGRFIGFDFHLLREAHWPVVVLAVAVDAILLVSANLVILPLLRSSFPIDRFTGGLIQPTLIFSVMRFALAVVGVALVVGGLRPRDVGLDREKLLSGALVVFGLWIVMQLVGILPRLISAGEVASSPIWTPERVPLIAGELIAQLLGNALAEETLFRGFLLMQVGLMLKGRTSGRGWHVTTAVLISQLIFSLSHIPQRIVSGYSLADLWPNLIQLWLVGIVFAVLYLRTENIFICVGVHTLVNAPVTILAMPSEAAAVLLPLILALVLIAVWEPLMGLMARRGGALQQSPSAAKQLMQSER